MRTVAAAGRPVVAQHEACVIHARYPTLQTRSAAGKWQAATAGDAPAASGGGEAPFCCLRYDDSGNHAEWVRFVSDSVGSIGVIDIINFSNNNLYKPATSTAT